jgi:hypothetical protein
MAARRLLIVMLILLGLSTLAAALVPQHALRGGTTGSTTTRTTQSTTTPAPAGRQLTARIMVGGKKIPVVAGPVCVRGKCGEPIHVGDQLSLEVFARKQAELEVPSFGFVGVANKAAPALFQLLFDQPTTVGIVFTSTGQPAAKIEVLSTKAAAKAAQEQKAKAKTKQKPGTKRRARGGSGRS